jgi:hypothetical protein
MKIIAHRGNVDGPNPSLENNPSQIDACIALGFDAEVDLRSINSNLYLNHDRLNELYKIDYNWLLKRKNTLWIHCKDFDSLVTLINLDQENELNYFYHESDPYTLTSKNIIWSYPDNKFNNRSIILDFELTKFDPKQETPFGVCTDYPLELKNKINESI